MIDDAWYQPLRCFISFVVTIFFPLKIFNKKNIPQNGPCLIVANHRSNLDALLLMSMTKRTIHFMAKDDLIHGHFHLIFKHMGIIPVKRHAKSTKSIKQAIEYLNKGEIVVIFPEGTFNKQSNQMLPFKYGALSIAKKTGFPILPIGISHKVHIFGQKVQIKIGNDFILNQDLEKSMNKLQKIVESLAQKI